MKMIKISKVLGALLLTGFVGLNQLVFVTFGACPASLVIDRLRPAAAQA